MTKLTTRAFFVFLISMMLCVTILIGNTFAWFTDSASTGVNTIVAGNLDIELHYGQVENGAIAYEEVVEDTTLLFNDKALWEPGYTEVAYIKVANTGTLALKALLTVNFSKQVAGVNAAGDEIMLSDYLMYDIIEIAEGEFYADRAAARAAAEAGAVNISTEQNEVKLAANAAPLYYALVVYMPEEVANEANYVGDVAPSINLGITLIATQDTVENDSFDNQYDAESEYPSNIQNNEGLLEALASSDNVTIKNGNYALPLEIPEGKTLNVEGGDFTLPGGNTSMAAFDLNKGGNLTISTSDITVTNYNLAVDVAEDSKLTINAGTYAASNIQVFNAQKNGAEVVINGGTIEGTVGVWIRGDVTVEINDGIFDCTAIALTDDPSNNCVVTINGGTFDTSSVDASTGVKTIIIKGGTFKFNPTQYVDTAAYDVTLADGWYTVTAK